MVTHQYIIQGEKIANVYVVRFNSGWKVTKLYILLASLASWGKSLTQHWLL